MKIKVFTVCLLLSGFSILTKAQTIINPSVGLVFMNLTKAPSGVEFKSKSGIDFGVEFRREDRVFFVAGLRYTQPTVEAKSSSIFSSSTTEMKFTYIKLDAGMGYNFMYDKDNNMGLRLIVGFSMEGLLDVSSAYYSDKADYLGFGSSLRIGAGYDYKFLSFDAGYNKGLLKVFKDGTDSSGFTEYPSSHMNGFYARIGAIIRFGD